MLRSDRERVRTLAFSPDGARLAAAGNDGAVRVWNLADDQMTERTGHTDAVYRVGFSPDGTLLASASRDHTVRVWASDGPGHILRGHGDYVLDVGFAPSGDSLVSTSANGETRLWRRDAADARSRGTVDVRRWIGELTTAVTDRH
jgi:WD40 repeat protein